MKVEFYLYNSHEIAGWAPLWQALVQRGVEAQFVVEPLGTHTAHGSRPDPSNGYHDAKSGDLVPLMTPEMYAEIIGHLNRAGCAYAKEADYRAEAAVTTQGHYWLRHYHGLKIRTGYGVSPHRDAWGYGEAVNRDMDAVLTHGEIPAALTRNHIPAERVLIGGYPKFDAYFRGQVDRAEWQQQFGLDPRRPTVVYFSTWAHNSSLDAFAAAIAALGADYNVLYKPHHNNLFFEPERLAALRQTPGVLIGQELSSVPYYAVADLVLADVRSGSLTEAFLTQRRVIALSPFASPADERLIPEVAAVVDVCRNPQALPGLVAASLDQPGSAAAQQALAPRLFSDYQGHAAAVSAEMLIDLVERARRRAAVRAPAQAAASPLYSVIIPTYKRPETLKKCLDALTRQSVPSSEFEVLVSDDGSPDNTPEVVQTYPAPFRLTYLRQPNSGPAAARNRAIERAQGEYLLILNDDALLEPDALAIHQAAQARGGGREAVLGMFRFLPEHAATPFGYLMQHSFLLFAYGTLHGGQVYQLMPGQLLNYMWFYTCNVSLRRQFILDIGGFDESFSGPAFEDLDLGLRLEQSGVPLRYDPRSVAWHDHAQSPERYCKVNEMRKRWMLAFCLKYPTSAWFRNLTPDMAREWRLQLQAAAPKAQLALARLDQMNASLPPGAPEDDLKRVAMEMYPLAQWLTDYTDRQGMLNSPFLDEFLAANVELARQRSAAAKPGVTAPAVVAPAPPARTAKPPAVAPKSASRKARRQERRVHGGRPEVELSVVIPTYNRQPQLERCLQALSRQTLDPAQFEVIVVDDGSTDGTSAWLAAQPYPFTLRALRQDNAGPGQARNRAVAEARGRVVVFLGDDTYADPGLLAGHLAFHAEHRNAAEAVVGLIDWAPDQPVTPFMEFIVGPAAVQFGFGNITNPEQAGYHYFYSSNLSLKRAFLEQEQPLFDPDYWYAAWEDIDLGYRLERRGMRLRYRPQLLVHHDHPTDIARYCRRQFRAGQMARVFAGKQPACPLVAGVQRALALAQRDASLAGLEPDERLLASVHALEARLNGQALGRDDRHMLFGAYDRLLARAYQRGLLAGADRNVPPPELGQPSPNAQATLERLLNAPDPGAALRENLDAIDVELLGLLRVRARAARLAGQADLALALDEFAQGAAALLDAVAEAPAEARAADLYNRLLEGDDDIEVALEHCAGELSDAFLELVRANAGAARHAGDLELAEGLDGLAEHVLSYLGA